MPIRCNRGLCVQFAGCCFSNILQTRHITLSYTPDQQLESHSTKYHRQQPLYNTLEFLMMGIVVPETCSASNKICNKNLCYIYFHIFHLNYISLNFVITIIYLHIRWTTKNCKMDCIASQVMFRQPLVWYELPVTTSLTYDRNKDYMQTYLKSSEHEVREHLTATHVSQLQQLPLENWLQ